MFAQFRGGTVNGAILLGSDRASLIDGFSQDVENPAEGYFTDRYGDRGAGIHTLLAADHTIGATQSHYLCSYHFAPAQITREYGW